RPAGGGVFRDVCGLTRGKSRERWQTSRGRTTVAITHPNREFGGGASETSCRVISRRERAGREPATAFVRIRICSPRISSQERSRRNQSVSVRLNPAARAKVVRPDPGGTRDVFTTFSERTLDHRRAGAR